MFDWCENHPKLHCTNSRLRNSQCGWQTQACMKSIAIKICKGHSNCIALNFHGTDEDILVISQTCPAGIVLQRTNELLVNVFHMVNTFINSLVFSRISSHQIGSYFVFHNICPLHASLYLLSSGEDLSKSNPLKTKNKKKAWTLIV